MSTLTALAIAFGIVTLWTLCLIGFAQYLDANHRILTPDEVPEIPEDDVDSPPSWLKHPRYIADPGGLFGAPPRLECRRCSGSAYELFYGHCKVCCGERDIPMSSLEPQDFHEQMGKGFPAVSSAFKEGDDNSPPPRKPRP